MTGNHIAQFNVARLKYDIEDPRIADFVNNLNRVNAAAERSPGFVWRLREEAGDYTAVVDDDPMVIPNLSVWENVESLENFVFKTVHKRIYERRTEWFGVMEKMHLVMWPVESGHEPTVKEAWERLGHLNEHGSSGHAFGWDHIPSANLWRSTRCETSAA
ncbi:DUF3291 domain-containing protein [Roseibium marinum]|uniref:Uncharacterized protein DUF3291 n=1 Tax=Roseibium marinum TaxID=281252 RepID=A0A2S3UNV7_9HYPH|nr:DUF3291 domain-containing protein [Roseibium marinum]POF29408.1 uncharacterized protein DUF3291 [Roseibium marinum]